jgi:hypothetical protein
MTKVVPGEILIQSTDFRSHGNMIMHEISLATKAAIDNRKYSQVAA